MSLDPKHIAVIGGGRWARVIAGVLLDFVPGGTRLSLCSPRYPLGWQQWLKDQPADRAGKCIIAADMNTLLDDKTLQQVFVVRAARDNFSTALSALQAGKSVFIEKPFAFDQSEAEKIVAATRSQTSVTGLVYLFAPNILRFIAAIQDIGSFEKIAIQWYDPADESRYGEAKNYDPGVNCVRDVFPHIWSLLRLLAPDAPLSAVDVETSAGGRQVRLELLLGQSRVEVEITREADERSRKITLSGNDNNATIDFSSEPGCASINGVKIDVTSGFSSPLACELKSFFKNSFDGIETTLYKCDRAVESIVLADWFMLRVRRDQVNQIVIGLGDDASQCESHNADYALREVFMESFGNLYEDQGLHSNSPASYKITWQTVRKWLTDEFSDNDIPACVRNETTLCDLKRRLSQ